MIQIQLLSKILLSKDYNIVEENLLDSSYFMGYEKEFDFIKDHYKKYKKVPDKASFLAAFPDFDIIPVSEPTKYLIDKIREEHLYQKTAPLLKEAADLYKKDANRAVEYIIANFKDVPLSYKIGGTDIIANSKERLEAYKDKKENQDEHYFKSGFRELDEITHGIKRGEEFFVIFARVNQGKSWVLEKMCTEVWKQGFNVGYFSPEMTAESIGYRFDTLNANFSNKDLMWGNTSRSITKYENYIKNLSKEKAKLIVTTPVDFDRNVTVSKLRNWVRQEKLDMIALDGLTYIRDERAQRGDNKTTRLTNISEDLMSLSVEMGIPVLAVIQANRNAVSEEDDKLPDLEHIRDSDGVAHNCSKIISIKHKHGILEIGIKKQRNGRVGDKLRYTWDIDTGNFVWIPSDSDNLPDNLVEHSIEQEKNKYKDLGEVF